LKAYTKYSELKVKAYLSNRFPDMFTHNARIVLGNCSAPYRRFLDFYVLIGNTLLVVEVDEKQHRSYDDGDEVLRIHEILHNIGFDKKMVFIRFNPDSFRTNGKLRRVSFEDRLDELGRKIEEVVGILESGGEYEDVHMEIRLFFDSAEREFVSLVSLLSRVK